MFLYERGFEWLRRNSGSYEETMAAAAKQQKKPGQQELETPENVQESVSKAVFDNDSIYAFNETYMDVRTPNDEKRGVIALAVIGLYVPYFYWVAKGFFFLLHVNLAGVYDDGEPAGIPEFLSLFFIAGVVATVIVLSSNYVWPYVRLELFTARRIVVRFNRVTRRVYLLRPNHCGGVASMDWDKTHVIVDKAMRDLQGMGAFVWLAWDRHDGIDASGQPTDMTDCTFIGKPTRNAEELLAFWEYIRRYMEEGPQAVPPPRRLLPKFPSPWHSFRAVWGLDTGFLGDARLWIFVLLRLMLLPAIVLHALGHWVSLLLCYEPKFPKDIENAGR